jgi:hypothetical protein
MAAQTADIACANSANAAAKIRACQFFSIIWDIRLQTLPIVSAHGVCEQF